MPKILVAVCYIPTTTVIFCTVFLHWNFFHIFQTLFVACIINKYTCNWCLDACIVFLHGLAFKIATHNKKGHGNSFERFAFKLTRN